jgi:hypothetical protein
MPHRSESFTILSLIEPSSMGIYLKNMGINSTGISRARTTENPTHKTAVIIHQRSGEFLTIK